MPRTTVYNKDLTENYEKINKKDRKLLDDFVDYCRSMDKTELTIKNYKSQIKIFLCWNKKFNKDTFFCDLQRKDFLTFFGYARTELKVSPARIYSFKAALSSFSTAIEILYEKKYKNFRNLVRDLPSIPQAPVREKTILSDEEVQLILDTLLERGKLQACCIVAVLAYSGMRKAELLQMRPEYFDESHIIFDALHQTDLIRAKGRGKNGHQMHKWILMQGDKYIMPWIEKRKENGIECEWLFCTRDGDSWRKLESVDHIMDYISEIVDKPVYAHSFRHFVCTRMLTEYNLPSEVVREFFQWESVEMTKVYCDRNTMDDFGKYFSADGIVKQEEKSLSDLK